MPIVFERAIQDYSDSGSTFVFDFTNAATEGNLLIACITMDTAEVLTAPAGWTEIENTIVSGILRSAMYYKVAGASEPTSYTWTLLTTRKTVGGALELSGVDQVSPVNASDVGTGNDAAPISPTITTDADGCLIVACYGVNNMNYSKALDGTVTERWDRNSGSGGAAVGTIGGTIAQATLGATGTYTHNNGETNEWIAFTVAIKPDAASGPYLSNDPSGTFGSKVGQVYSGSEIDANAWFTSSGGTLTFGEETLPAGLSLDGNTGYITGTLSQAAGNFNATIEAYDDNATAPNGTSESFTWDIANYQLVFSGTTKLLDTGGSPYDPTTTVSFSAITGTIDGGLSGTVYDWPAEAVASGAVTLSFSDIDASGTWTVFAQDDSDGTILGVYEIVAE